MGFSSALPRRIWAAVAVVRRAIVTLWRMLLQVPPQRAQQAVTAIFLAVVFFIGMRAGIKQIKRWRTCHPAPTDDALGYSDPIYPQPTAFRDSKALTRPPNACAEVADFPQVALLFLTRDEMAHDVLWREWFAQAAGKLPAAAAGRALCNTQRPTAAAAAKRRPPPSPEALAAACGLRDGGKLLEHDVISQQHLFDVWVHTLIDFPGFPIGSPFRLRELPPKYRVRALWGTHTLVDATRALLAAALTNPRATKFVLISESDVPLYSPLVLYSQMLGEPQSRLNACNTTVGWKPNDGWRVRPDMLAEGLTLPLWRKSWQWFALRREHAQLAVDDRKVDAAFRATCRRRWDPDWCSHRVCYSDEHYFATLVATHGGDNATDCRGELTDRDWSRGLATDAHPWEYSPQEVTANLLRKLRHAERQGCAHAERAATAAASQFLDAAAPAAAGGLSSSELCRIGPPKYRLLGPHCPLLARKFLNRTRNAVLAALLPCKRGLSVINDAAACSGVRAEQQHALLKKLDFSIPLEEEEVAEVRAAAVLAVVALTVACILAFVVQRQVQGRRQRPPMVNNESFHTMLKRFGVME